MKTKEKLVLVKPRKKDAAEIMQFRQEFIDNGEGDSMPGANKLNQFDKFEDWWKYIKAFEKQKTVPIKGFVPSFEYLLRRKSDGKLLGMLQIRARLNENLFFYGGNFGGCIRPSERSKGYSTQMISMGMKKAKRLGLKKILITCLKTNLASAKSIKKAGGVLEDELVYNNDKMQRYWLRRKK